MSEDLIYKVAEEIYMKQDEIKQQIVELKDLLIEKNESDIIKNKVLIALIKENSDEMSKISSLVLG